MRDLAGSYGAIGVVPDPVMLYLMMVKPEKASSLEQVG